MSWKPTYDSANRVTVGAGGSLFGFCGLYSEVPTKPLVPPVLVDAATELPLDEQPLSPRPR